LKATHEALLKSEELLSAKVKRDEEARQRFDEMQVELTRLTDENISMVSFPSTNQHISHRLTFLDGRKT